MKDTMFAVGSRPHVSILMATYDGARYLPEQVDSIVAQSWTNWTLYVRDDGSQDETPAILERHARKHPSRIRIVPTDGKRLGVNGNFAHLAEVAEGPYFMFCDQDDVWLPQKIEKTFQCMWSLERQAGPGTPILAFTDLRPVDASLKELDSSIWHFGNHDPEHGKRLNRLLMQNMVHGCTILMNTALKEKALPVPAEAVAYDWWFALVAASLGKIDYVPEPTMLYRLHGGNTVGATEWGPLYVWRKLTRFLDPAGLVESLQRSQRQAAALVNRHEGLLSEGQCTLLRTYATLRQKGFLARRAALVKYGLYKTGLVRNAGLFARI